MAKRPSTKEILEAARKGGAAPPSEGSGGVPEPEVAESASARGGKPAGAAVAAQPAAAKTAAAPAAKSAAARVLPPLEKMTDPRDLAEAARQAASKRARDDLAAKSAAAAPAAAKPKAAPA